MAVPRSRIRVLVDSPLDCEGAYVVYWMTAARRLSWNFALDRAVELALEVGRPLVVFEALRCDYPWASDRLHAFVLDGMEEHWQESRNLPIHYLAYVEPHPGHGKGLLEALSARAVAVVTDDFPFFFCRE